MGTKFNTSYLKLQQHNYCEKTLQYCNLWSALCLSGPFGCCQNSYKGCFKFKNPCREMIPSKNKETKRSHVVIT